MTTTDTPPRLFEGAVIEHESSADVEFWAIVLGANANRANLGLRFDAERTSGLRPPHGSIARKDPSIASDLLCSWGSTRDPHAVIGHEGWVSCHLRVLGL